MGIRSVRLDEETEKALEQVVTATGLSVSGAMKKGLLILRNEVAQEARRIPYDVYKELDLGPGGYTVAPATQTRRGVRMAIRRSFRRRSWSTPGHSSPSSIQGIVRTDTAETFFRHFGSRSSRQFPS